MLSRSILILTAIALAACNGNKHAPEPSAEPEPTVEPAPEPEADVDPEPTTADTPDTPDVDEPSDMPTALVGVKWVLTTMDGTTEDVTDSPQHLFFGGESGPDGFTGYGGCNRLFGQYTQDGGAIAFPSVGATRMACPSLGSEQEFTRVLSAVDGLHIADETLTLTEAGTERATFTAE